MIGGLEENGDVADFDGDGLLCARQSRCRLQAFGREDSCAHYAHSCRGLPGFVADWCLTPSNRVRSKCAARRVFAKVSEFRTPHRRSLVQGWRRVADFTGLPCRRIEVTRPSNRLASTEGSSWVRASPRVAK